MCRNYENNSIMAHGLHSMIKSEIGCSGGGGKPRVEHQRPGGNGSSGAAGKMGSRRIFTPQFKLQVLDSYRNDSDCKGNQRATARKYGIHRRQIQKWLQVENNLRSAAANSASNGGTSGGAAMKINLIGNHPQQQSQQPQQFQLHPHHHHHLHHPHHHHMQHVQNLNSIELKVPLDSARHRVAQANASSNNNNTILLGKESSGSSSACIISPVPTHTVAPVPFSHPHETSLSSTSSASLSVLKAHSRGEAVLAASQVLRPSFSPASVAAAGDFPAAPTPTHHPYDRLNLLDPYYPHHPFHHYAAKYAIDCPIDLSQSHYRKHLDQALSPCSSTISSIYSSRPRSPCPLDIKSEESCRESTTTDDGCPPEDCEAVDLSCRKRKASLDSLDGPSPPKSVKLFKPYLLDEKDADSVDKDDKDSSIESPVGELPPDPTAPGGRLDYPIIWNFHAQQRYYESLYGAAYHPASSPPSAYLRQPLTPIPRTPFTTLSPSPPSSTWAPPQASPVSGYDSSTSISSSVYDGDEGGCYSYSLELKQQAIDSFYHDVSCRGDFRAVASKYNIQRKYVEKWLAQEDHHAAPPPQQAVLVG